MGETGESLKAFSETLLTYRRGCCPPLPKPSRIYSWLDDLLHLLFPHFSTESFSCAAEVQSRLGVLQQRLEEILLPTAPGLSVPAAELTARFFAQLPDVHQRLQRDALALYEGDPAAESVDEIILAYPGFMAIAIYRLAHEFYLLQVPLFPRILTEYAHQLTGIDIHPGAQIGESFFIDHGTGVVIGETTQIGNQVKIYQGVTLGALSVEKVLAHQKRHPTIEDRVVIYSNATILGGATTVGHDSVIGGNVWLTESVPPLSTVYHKSEIKVRSTAVEG